MMTKKDYEKAARVVRVAFPSKTSRVRREAVVNAFVIFFLDDSPRFDEARFRKACRPEVHHEDRR